MNRPDEITCLCGNCFGVMVGITGQMTYETRCRKCKRIMSVRIKEDGISVRVAANPLKGHRQYPQDRPGERRYQPA